MIQFRQFYIHFDMSYNMGTAGLDYKKNEILFNIITKSHQTGHQNSKSLNLARWT